MTTTTQPVFDSESAHSASRSGSEDPSGSRVTSSWPRGQTRGATETPGLAFLRYVMEALVEEKDKLIIEGTIDEQGVLLTVQVGKNDMGKLIGKGGQTVKALRTLLRIIGGRTNHRMNLKVLEPASAP